jgi:hypothetical protein
VLFTPIFEKIRLKAKGGIAMNLLTKTWEKWGLVLGRIVIGYLWYTQLLWKLPPTFGCPANFAASTDLAHRTSGLCDWTGLMATYSIWPLHREFVKNIVAPNLSWMGWGVFLLEAFITVSLVLGLFSRLGGLLGFLQAANLYLGLTALPFEWYWTYGMLMTLEAIFFFTAPGRVLGIDQLLIQALRPGAERGNKLAQGLLLLM